MSEKSIKAPGMIEPRHSGADDIKTVRKERLRDNR